MWRCRYVRDCVIASEVVLVCVCVCVCRYVRFEHAGSGNLAMPQQNKNLHDESHGHCRVCVPVDLIFFSIFFIPFRHCLAAYSRWLYVKILLLQTINKQPFAYFLQAKDWISIFGRPYKDLHNINFQLCIPKILGTYDHQPRHLACDQILGEGF